jgi:glycosyltransferase involved in cell wall biosynthesis
MTARAATPTDDLRVVLTCDWFLKYSAHQAAGLVAAGAQVLLLCRDHALEFDGDERERQATLELARRGGVTVVEIPGRMSDPRAARALVRIARQIAQMRPHLVHAHDGADPRALALLTGLPTVLTLHDPVLHPGQPVPVARKRWFLHGTRDAWRTRAGVIVVHSDRLRDETVLAPGQTISVVPHGIHVEAEPLPVPAAPTVAFFGRLAPYKGLDVLAEAMPRVWSRRPEVRLRVAGEGPTDLPLSDPRVELQRRYLPESEIPAFLAATTLIVLPYTQASQSGAGSLAAGYGVPVIASRLGGLPDLVLDEGYLVAGGDAEGLAEAILRHLDDGLPVRRRVLAQVAAPRSWEAAGRRSLGIYRDLLAHVASGRRVALARARRRSETGRRS